MHTLLSPQASGVPVPQDPPLQISRPLQRVLSSHSLLLFVCVQPVAPLQPSVVHELLSSQLGADPPTHAPAEQTSPVVHALPSSQALALLV